MAITITTSNHYKYMLAKGSVDLSADTLKVIFMNTAFSFNEDTHSTSSDVSSYQISSGYGYTQNYITLNNLSLIEDDVNDKAIMTCDDVVVTAVGGDIGPFGSIVIYDQTTSDNTVICCIDLGSDITIVDGFSFLMSNISNEVS